MNKTIYLHIGQHRTGSTSLQVFLATQQEALARHGFTYRLGKSTFHSFFKALLFNDAKELNRLADSLNKEMVSIGSDNIIFSWEDFFGYMPTTPAIFTKDCADFLQKAFTGAQVRIICYLRRQDYFAESMWFQLLKNGYRDPFDVFIEQEETKFHWDKIVDGYAEVFGDNALQLRTYETTKLINNDICSDFISLLPIDKDFAEAVAVRKQRRMNTSMSPALSRIILALNQDFQLSPEDKERLIASSLPEKDIPFVLGDTDPRRTPFLSQWVHLARHSPWIEPKAKPLLFTPEERRAFLTKYKDSNASIAHKYFGRDDGILFDPFIPDGEVVQMGTPTQKDIIQVFVSAMNTKTARITTLTRKLAEQNQRLQMLEGRLSALEEKIERGFYTGQGTGSMENQIK